MTTFQDCLTPQNYHGITTECNVKLITPVGAVVSGATATGKSYFVSKLIENQYVMFDKSFDFILICYKIWQPLFNQLTCTVKNVNFCNYIPKQNEIDAILAKHKHVLIIIDDFMSDLHLYHNLLIDLFSVYVHHRRLSIFLIVQNLFYRSSRSTLRDVSLNANYLVIFKNARAAQQITTLASQMFCTAAQKKWFINCYNKAVTSRSHGYILLNLRSDANPNLQILTSILPNSNAIAFKPISD